jgi:hypothetical protein
MDIEQLKQLLQKQSTLFHPWAHDAYLLIRRLQAENAELRRELEEVKKARPQTPAEQFAIVMDRSYDGEGLSLAVHDGINFMFSDGDCYDRDGDTLDGYTAEFLTQYQLEQKLEEARKDADLKTRLDALSDEHRMELFGNYCRYCGCKNPGCQCWNDD